MPTPGWATPAATGTKRWPSLRKSLIDWGFVLWVGSDKSAVYGVNIQIAIAVVVEEGTPAAHSLGEVALRTAAVFVLPCQADGRRYFDKVERRGCGCGVLQRCIGGVVSSVELQARQSKQMRRTSMDISGTRQLGEPLAGLAQEVRVALPLVDKDLVATACLRDRTLGLVHGCQRVIGPRKSRIGGNGCLIGPLRPV